MPDEKFRKPESVTDGDPNLAKKEEMFLKALGGAQFDEYGNLVKDLKKTDKDYDPNKAEKLNE